MKNLKSVVIVLLRGVEPLYEEALREVVEAALNYYFDEFEVETKTLIPPPEAFNRDRNQYDAGKLISFLNEREPLRDLTIALIDGDLYYDNLKYIFGLAGVKSRRIIISTSRLKLNYSLTGMVSADVFRERVFKEVMHEIGHVLGLSHCVNPQCIMSFSSTLKEVDEKLPMLCETCKVKLGNMEKSTTPS